MMITAIPPQAIRPSDIRTVETRDRRESGYFAKRVSSLACFKSIGPISEDILKRSIR